MDDDALPSSFVMKVLPALSKWQVKVDALRGGFMLVDEVDRQDTYDKSLGTILPGFYFGCQVLHD